MGHIECLDTQMWKKNNMVQLNNKKISDNSQNDAIVFVTHVDNAQAAEDYASRLKEHGIPCHIEDQGNGIADFGFAIFTPEQFYDEACMIVEEQQATNCFYDFFFDDTPLGGQG